MFTYLSLNSVWFVTTNIGTKTTIVVKGEALAWLMFNKSLYRLPRALSLQITRPVHPAVSIGNAFDQFA